MVRTMTTGRRATPRHVLIAATLRQRIADGTYPRGGRLPSEAQLCEEFGTSRGPVRQAVETLRQEGAVTVSRGVAPVVRDAVPAHPFQSLVSFTEWAVSLGRTPGQRTLELGRARADGAIASRLEIEVGEPVVSLLRLRSMDGVAMMLERSSFPLDVGRHLFEPSFDPDAGSVYRHLRASGVDLSQGVHVIDAIGADAVDAEALDIAVGAPLLRVQRTVRGRDDRPLEAADDRYLPGLAAVSIENTAERRSSTLTMFTPDSHTA